MTERKNTKFERNLGKPTELRDERVRNAVELRKNAQDERLKTGRVEVPYSRNLINNADPEPSYFIDITTVIAGDPDIRCERDADPHLAEYLQAQAVDLRGTDVSEEAVDSDETPSSGGTDIGRLTTAFGLIEAIKTQVIVRCNADNGPFRNIQLMIHSLFYSRGHPLPLDRTTFQGNRGFVGFTPVGVLSEYTATIYYAATDSFTQYQSIIKIILSVMPNMPILVHEDIVYDFKLDRGVKPGDTIKLILSLTFGEDVGANVILIPVLNIVGFNLSSMNGVTPVQSIQNFVTHALPPNLLVLTPRGSFSIFDLIARIRLYANQEAFGALIEPTDAEKGLMQSFFAIIDMNGLVAFIQFIKFAFYTDTRIPHQDKNFAFFLNIFFNFFKVSMNAVDSMASRSTAKIMYTDFFSTHNNYGSIIRIFNNMMTQSLQPDIPLNQHAIMFLSGSNAARAYKLIEDILNMNIQGVTLEEIQARKGQIYDTHMATLSDNDFMFYLLNEGSQQYRLAIRMMLGACLYYLKYILNPHDRGQYTDLLEESISIVGHDDHLFAQRLNANEIFLTRCFNTIMSYNDTPNTVQNVTIENILGICMFHEFNFYQQLSGNVTLAFLDVVFKHNTAESWYISVFSIFGITPILAEDGTLSYRINIIDVTPIRAEDGTTIQSYQFISGVQQNVTQAQMGDVLTFLTTQAMAVNCIATPWTLILNILYTIFVTENCVARIVVGKLGNDPKNLEKYFSILNTHLTQLHEQYAQNAQNAQNADMLQKITTIGTLQTYIINQSRLCQQPSSVRYDTLKGLCTAWVQQMFTLALNLSTRELFFLSVAYRFTTREATLLEKGIYCAWTVEGNICNKADFLRQFTAGSVAAITAADFRPVYNAGNPNERTMHTIVPQLQGIISGAIVISQTFNVTPNPPLPGEQPINHYHYMNNLWKHLTNTSINLRSMFKSNVKDLKRIVGSKNFTAISLAGAYPCILLIDELLESNNTNGRDALIQERTSYDILNCRRGLLPLLVPADPNSRLFAIMVVDLLHIDYTNNRNNPEIYSPNNILIFLGFLFSIKIKSNASIGPRNMLSLVDSIINFPSIPADSRSLLRYTGDGNSPVPGTCSLSRFAENPDVGTCATGGVEHAGGAPTKKAPAAAKASTAPIKASAAIASGVSKPDSKEKKTPPTQKLTKAQQAIMHTEKKEAAVAAYGVRAPLTQLLNPPSGPFKNFMDKIYEVLQEQRIRFNSKTCITGITRQVAFNYGDFYNRPPYTNLRLSLGGSNKKNNITKSNNNLSKKNNHTRRNKNKRKKNSNSKTKFKPKSSSKYKKVIPSSRSGSQSNRKKSKPKKSQKNVTFKRRRARK